MSQSLYNDIVKKYKPQVEAFATRFLNQFMISSRRYARLDVMENDIVNRLFIELSESHERRNYTDRDLSRLTMDLLSIVSGLNPDFIGPYYSGNLLIDRLKDGMLFMDAETAVEKFLKSLSVTMITVPPGMIYIRPE
jgi:hypothetical protein